MPDADTELMNEDIAAFLGSGVPARFDSGARELAAAPLEEGGAAATPAVGVFDAAPALGFLLINFGGRTAFGLFTIFGRAPDGAILGKFATGTLPAGITVFSGAKLNPFGCGDAGCGESAA